MASVEAYSTYIDYKLQVSGIGFLRPVQLIDYVQAEPLLLVSWKCRHVVDQRDSDR